MAMCVNTCDMATGGTAEQRIHAAAMRLFAEKGGTQLSISELAEAAGVARGTVYGNVPDLDALLESVATGLAAEMHDRVEASVAHLHDPAERLSMGIRLFIRRAHEEPAWGRFLTRFAITDPSLKNLWRGAGYDNLRRGIEIGRFSLEAERSESWVAFMAGAAIAAIFLVIEGHRTFREAGSDVTEMMLRSLGLSATEAHAIGQRPLVPLEPKPKRPRA